MTNWGRQDDSGACWSGRRIDDWPRRSRRRSTGGQMEVGVSCHTGGVCFSPVAETKTGLNLQLNPWPAFDLVSRTGGGGQRAGRRGGGGCEMGACCCFEVPPRIWKRPIKQDYKSGTACLSKLRVQLLPLPSFFRWVQTMCLQSFACYDRSYLKSAENNKRKSVCDYRFMALLAGKTHACSQTSSIFIAKESVLLYLSKMSHNLRNVILHLNISNWWSKPFSVQLIVILL